MITVQTVKACLALGKATLEELCARLDIPAADFQGRDQVRKILRDLENFRQIEVCATEEVWTYRCLRDKPGALGAVQAKLWKFACHRSQKGQTFTAAEAAGLAECDRDYAKRYYRWLWAARYLALASRGRAGAILYRVVAGKEHEAAPPWNRRAEKRKKKPEGPQAGTPAPLTPVLPTSPEKQLEAVLDEFGQALVEIAGGRGRAVEIVRQMTNTILAVKEQGHGEPTEGHH